MRGGMATRVRPWFKAYPSDFISGCMKLTLEEKGAYVTILFEIYNEGGSIENNPQWLARSCGCSTRKFRKVLDALTAKRKICIEPGNRIHNPRAKKELLAAHIEAMRLGLTDEMRLLVYERDGYRCRYCQPNLWGLVPDCDHVIPVSRWGTNDLSNLATSCIPCNRSKGGKTLEEWRALA